MVLSKYHIDLLRKINNDTSEIVVKVGLLPYSPYVMPCWSNPNYDVSIPCDRPGLSVELMAELCGYIGIRCLQITANHTMFGDNLTGEWRGMIRQVQFSRLRHAPAVWSKELFQ